MTIREKYNILANSVQEDKLIDKIKSLRDLCLLEQNKEYLYLCNLLIIDIYIEKNELDEVLILINKDITDIDLITFSQIYVLYLERIIYVYINKGNYSIAFKYVFEKRNFIDDKDREEVNRWYLEMSYIYAEMNQLSKAVDHLKSIIENLPTEEMLALTLGNLTKLYIDQNMLNEAKETLNKALEVTTDQEGKIYCNYLYGKICLLEEKFDDALFLFNEILENDESQYLNITNDYLVLLIKTKKYDEAKSFIKRYEKNIESSSDNNTKKEFYKNKLKLLIAINDIPDANIIINEIDNLEKSTILKDSLVLEETLEDDKNNEVFNRLKTIVEKIEHIISLTNIAFSSNNVRDLLMEFSKKIETSIAFDEITYVLFDEILPFFNIGEQIHIYNFKKNRLYERSIDYENVKGTAVEIMMTSGNDVVFDFSETSVPLIDLFSGQKYIDLEVKYLVGLGSNEDDNLFLSVLFRTKHLDITSIENTIILKIITKLLSVKLFNLYIQERNRAINFFNDKIVEEANLYTVIHKNKRMVLSDSFASDLGFKNNLVTLLDYSKKIVKTDVEKYRLAVEDKLVSDVCYRINIKDKLLLINEKQHYYDNDDFKFSTIKINDELNNKEPDDIAFYNKIDELKTHVNDLEFKFSLLRFDAKYNSSDNLKTIFGFVPYYLSDETFIIILENEVNQRTLDKYINNLTNLTVVRFPRDLLNIDDVIEYSKISLKQNILYFSDEMYQKYLKGISLNNLVENVIKNPLELWYLKLNDYRDKQSFEIQSRINGLNNKENIRDYLNPIIQSKYEEAIINSFVNENPKVNYFFHFNIDNLLKTIESKKIKFGNNLYYCLYGNTKKLDELIKKLQNTGVKIFVHYKLLNNISVLDFESHNIDGIVINDGIQKEFRNQILGIANKYSLTILTNYEYNDYDKCIYKTDELVKEI